MKIRNLIVLWLVICSMIVAACGDSKSKNKGRPNEDAVANSNATIQKADTPEKETDFSASSKGVHDAGNDKTFMVLLAARLDPIFLNDDYFIDIFGQIYLGDEEFRKAKSNEFDWPKAKANIRKQAENVLSDKISAIPIYTTNQICLSQYDVATKSFGVSPSDRGESGFNNLGEVNVPNFDIPRSGVAANFINVEMVFDKPVTFDKFPVDEVKARKYVDSQPGRRCECLKISYIPVKGVYRKDKINEYNQEYKLYTFTVKPAKFELFSNNCEVKLGEMVIN